MNAADLRVFEVVARAGGMSRAAAELHTVQSNVSARVQTLEARLGTPLFDRHSRGVRLTAAGRRLLPYAIRLQRLLDEARRAVVDDGQPRGALTIGALETTAALRLSPVLAGYAAAYPDVDLALITGTSCELIEAVLEQRVEGAFVCGPVNHPALYQEPAFREELVLVTAPSAGTLADVLGRSDFRMVVLRAGCSDRQRLEDVLARRGVVGATPARVRHPGSDHGRGRRRPRRNASAAERGRGRRAGAGALALHRLPPRDAEVLTLFVRRHDAFVTSALAAFLEHARPATAPASAAA